MEPLPFSQYWIGSYTGGRRGDSIWVTPFVIEVIGASSPADIPSGYAMTLALGKRHVLLVHFMEPVDGHQDLPRGRPRSRPRGHHRQ